jgi:hypothetical protein
MQTVVGRLVERLGRRQYANAPAASAAGASVSARISR